MDFAPQNPGLQYLESVTVNGRAYMAGLRSGDFIIEVNIIKFYDLFKN